jgi:cytochrome c oxidase cbb3-type subunit I/II
MPAYPWMLTRTVDFAAIQRRVDVLAMLGHPYGEALQRAPEMAREQARAIATAIEAQGGPPGLEDKEIVAMVAYLQRLGTDLRRAAPAAAPAGAP